MGCLDELFNGGPSYYLSLRSCPSYIDRSLIFQPWLQKIIPRPGEVPFLWFWRFDSVVIFKKKILYGSSKKRKPCLWPVGSGLGVGNGDLKTMGANATRSKWDIIIIIGRMNDNRCFCDDNKNANYFPSSTMASRRQWRLPSESTSPFNSVSSGHSVSRNTRYIRLVYSTWRTDWFYTIICIPSGATWSSVLDVSRLVIWILCLVAGCVAGEMADADDSEWQHLVASLTVQTAALESYVLSSAY